MKQIFFAIGLITALTTTSLADQAQDRIVVVGDLHGDYQAYMDVLQAAGLINETGRRWTGGNAHLVQLGDVLDRGPDGLAILEHLDNLSRQAQRRGGTIHRLIGNHEAMHLTGDYRYVDPGEYAALIDRRSEDRRDAFFDRMVDANAIYAHDQGEPFDAEEYRQHLLSEWPLGKYEYVSQFAQGGEQRDRILGLAIALQLGDFVFVHGGLSPEYAAMGLDAINAQGVDELEAGVIDPNALINDPNGPLWHRAYAFQEDNAEADLQAALDALDAEIMVVGHTPLSGQVSSLYNGRLILADVGLSDAYRGARSFLEIAPDGTLQAWVDGVYLPVMTLEN